MNFRDLVSGIAFLILGITAAWMGKAFYADAAYIPVGVGVLMGMFSLPLIWRGIADTIRKAPLNTPVITTALVDNPLRFSATLACCLIYYTALPYVGFYTTSTLFIGLLAYVLGERRPAVIAGITVGFIALLYLLFAVVLKRPLPTEFFLAY